VPLVVSDKEFGNPVVGLDAIYASKRLLADVQKRRSLSLFKRSNDFFHVCRS